MVVVGRVTHRPSPSFCRRYAWLVDNRAEERREYLTTVTKRLKVQLSMSPRPFPHPHLPPI